MLKVNKDCNIVPLFSLSLKEMCMIHDQLKVRSRECYES